MWKKSSYKQELVDKNIQIIQKASSILLKNLNLYAE